MLLKGRYAKMKDDRENGGFNADEVDWGDFEEEIYIIRMDPM
jgi:hypothetical protein